METVAKTITQCDNCRKAIDMKEEKGEAFKATLTDRSTQKAKLYHYCTEECLRQHLNSRSKKKKSKASVIDNCLEIEVIFEKTV